MLAPAEVPPMVDAAVRGRPDRLAERGPVDDRRQLELVAAGHEDAGDVVEQGDERRVVGVLAVLGSYADDLGARRAAEQRGVDLDDLGAERGGGRDHGDPRSLAARAFDEVLQHGAPLELVLRAADRRCRVRGPDGAAGLSDAAPRVRPAPCRPAAQPSGRESWVSDGPAAPDSW